MFSYTRREESILIAHQYRNSNPELYYWLDEEDQLERPDPVKNLGLALEAMLSARGARSGPSSMKVHIQVLTPEVKSQPPVQVDVVELQKRYLERVGSLVKELRVERCFDWSNGA